MSDLKIGLTAHLVVGNLCFVRVPSERGRWVLTDLSVITVSCPICEAIVGEPCRRYYGLSWWDRRFPDAKPMAHGVGTHVARRCAAQQKYGRHYATRLAEIYKLRMTVTDLEDALQGEIEPVFPDAVDVDFPIVRRKGVEP